MSGEGGYQSLLLAGSAYLLTVLSHFKESLLLVLMCIALSPYQNWDACQQNFHQRAVFAKSMVFKSAHVSDNRFLNYESASIKKHRKG